MNPIVKNITEEDNFLKFEISQINVSLANAIRRVILSEIPNFVIKTSNHDKNKANIIINTTRMNNELIKQRLSCIPIHIDDDEFPFKNYIIEFEKENKSNVIEYLTTKDIRIKNITNDTYLSNEDTRKIFPPDTITNDFIDIVRLRPKLSENLPGEHIKIKCNIDIGTAKEDSAFNVVSTCSYAASQDLIKINEQWFEKEKQLKKDGFDKDKIEYFRRDWMALDAKRIIIPDSFNFIVETVGQLSNTTIVNKAIKIIIDKLNVLNNYINSNDDMLILNNNTTIDNCYDMTFQNEGYTIGKIIEYILYEKFYKNKILTFCGFNKPHPHIDVCIIRIATKDSINKTTVKQYFTSAIDDAIDIFKKLKESFTV